MPPYDITNPIEGGSQIARCEQITYQTHITVIFLDHSWVHVSILLYHLQEAYRVPAAVVQDVHE